MIDSCPSPLDLERGFFTGDALLAAHARGCAVCGESWRQIGELSSLAKLLEAPPSSPERSEQIRSALVSMSPSVRRARWPWAVTVAVAVAAAVVAVWPEQAVERTLAVHRARITPLDRAQFSTFGAPPDEMVRLVDGSLSIEVDPLERGKRFRVITGDAEIEVKGTSFDVTAASDRLQEVEVLSGVVEVRHGGAVTVLPEGGRWTAPRPAPAVKRAPPSSQAPAPNRNFYEEGWSSLVRGDFEKAAASFERALTASRDPILREDAEFFLGVALARAGRTDRAIETFERFLSVDDRSRSGEAAAILGWMRFDRDDDDRAAALFERAVRSSSARGKASGAQGLEALRRKRARQR